MNKKLYFGGLGILMLIGFFISLANLAGDEDYYREHQQFNHLPSLQADEPAPIEHYKEKIDESNQATETNAQIVNLESNNQTSVLVFIGKPINDMVGGRTRTNISDGTIGMIVLAFMMLQFVFVFGRVRR